MFHLGHILGERNNNAVGLLIAISAFKDDLPWLYELGLDVYRKVNSGSSTKDSSDAIQRLQEACDAVAHNPLFRDIVQNEDAIYAAVELRGFLKHWKMFNGRPDVLRKKAAESGT
jgi:hypothetical protein